MRGARWLSGRVLDSGARSREFETFLRRVVSLSTLPPKVLVIPRKQWLSPNMTEKLLTGTFSLNTKKKKLKKLIDEKLRFEEESSRVEEMDLCNEIVRVRKEKSEITTLGCNFLQTS